MKQVDLTELLESGAHFGHKTNKWNPKAAPYIYKPIGDTHIIDLAKTKKGLEDSAEAIIKTKAKGGEIILVGTKRQAKMIVQGEAKRVGMPYMNVRWIGGLITNWKEVKKNIQKLNDLEKDLKDEQKMKLYTKRERLLMERDLEKLNQFYGGIRSLKKPPAMIVVIDVKKEFTAIAEAIQKDIKVVGVLDTNADPSDVDYVIPANDDAVGSLSYIISYLADAYEEGLKERIKVEEQQEKERQAQEKKTREEREKREKEKKQAQKIALKKASEKAKKPEKKQTTKTKKEQ